ncbi:MAG TPA: hypothetical protein PLY99_13630, partial [Acidovorax temperans]|nr:hypothetical protein [Acidovorax temperans]
FGSNFSQAPLALRPSPAAPQRLASVVQPPQTAAIYPARAKTRGFHLVIFHNYEKLQTKSTDAVLLNAVG